MKKFIYTVLFVIAIFFTISLVDEINYFLLYVQADIQERHLSDKIDKQNHQISKTCDEIELYKQRWQMFDQWGKALEHKMEAHKKWMESARHWQKFEKFLNKILSELKQHLPV